MIRNDVSGLLLSIYKMRSNTPSKHRPTWEIQLLLLKSISRKAIKLTRLSSRPLFRRGLTLGIAASIEHEDAIRSVSFDTLVDVGANVGQFSLLARQLHPHTHIHAFEPLPAAANKYSRLFAQDSSVHLYQLAAGETPGEAVIHVSGRPDSSSLLPITNLQDELFPGTAQKSTHTVRVERIDTVLQNATLTEPLLIKLDVQGYELSALKGMPKLLSRARYVYSEVSFKELYEGQPLASDVVAWLANKHFRLAGAYNPTTAADGSAIQADMLFAKEPN